MKRLGLALIFAAMGMIPARSQAPQRPSFEVASIKPNNSGSSGSSTNSNDTAGYIKAANTTLRQFILRSYRLLTFQLIGGPGWIDTDRFDIEAKGSTASDPGRRSEIMRQMMQSLLEERLQLKIHRETRELPVFILTVTKDGSKLQPTVEGRAGPGGLKSGSSRTSGTSAGVEMSGSGLTMDSLINMIATSLDKPVIDKTNLTGKYDFSLKFAPSGAPAAAPDTTAEPIGPSLFTAIQEQLGLKLESAKGPVEVVVIDSVQRPTEN